MKSCLTVWFLVLLSVIVCGTKPAVAQDTPVCDEFISRANCRVTIDMTSVGGEVSPRYKVAVPVQSDVMINSGGTASTVLQKASPFLACSIAATPGAPGRDLSSAVTAALTTVGSLAIPSGPPPLAPASGSFYAVRRTYPEDRRRPASPEAKLAEIEAEVEQVSGLNQTAFAQTASLYDSLRDTLRANWHYSFGSEEEARDAITRLNNELSRIQLGSASPDLVRIQVLSKKAQDELSEFYKTVQPSPGSDIETLAEQVGSNLTVSSGNADLLIGAASDLKKKVKQFMDVLRDIATIDNKTQITLPMASYRQKAVSESITCKDVVSGVQPFDAITFTAYYEKTPVFDISAGAIISLLPGRQVGTVSGPLAPGAASTATLIPTSGACGAFNPSETCLGITSTTRPQFMPAAFFEWHPINTTCPWAFNGEARHPFGYLCSLGLAGGVSVNPNNGTASAEFFEGVSVGIQRVAFLFGVHNGRYQTFADGYYVGEAVPSGTTARTERVWTSHFAIGIAYRVPLR